MKLCFLILNPKHLFMFTLSMKGTALGGGGMREGSVWSQIGVTTAQEHRLQLTPNVFQWRNSSISFYCYRLFPRRCMGLSGQGCHSTAGCFGCSLMTS